MRSYVTLAATALLATGILVPASSAQSAPSTEQITKSLTFPDQPTPHEPWYSPCTVLG
jgi:hypothetical protein